MTRATRARSAEPISMREAVGYATIDCDHQATIDEALVAKHNRLFLLVDQHGDISPPGNCGLGLFHDDTRILSHYALSFSGGRGSLLSSRSTEMFSLQVDLAITDRKFGGDSWDPKNSIHVRRDLLLTDRFVERVTVTSFLPEPIDFEVTLSVAADFADIFEVRGWKREKRGQFLAPQTESDRLCFLYEGLDGREIRSRVIFGDVPDQIGPGGATWRCRLHPGTPQVLEWQVLPESVPEEVEALEGESFFDPLPSASLYRQWRQECATWWSDLGGFNSALAQSVTDLRGLYGEVGGEEVIYAGIPWYTTIFGRDSIIVSLQTLPLNPRIAKDTLRYLARHQGWKEDSFTEEQPGKIMHELRRGEMARAGETPHVPYYGTIDATPLWLILLHEAWLWTGDDELVRELLPNAKRALDWIDRFGDRDGDGFVEYHRTSEKGLVNQGWKDSGDGVPFPDGSMPEPPIALVEVQGYVCDARRRMAAIFEHLGDLDRAGALRREAEKLRAAIQEQFWLDDTGTFAIALDGKKRPVRSATTNAGHLLWSGVPTDEQARRMSEHLLSRDMFCGWGLRTLSASHKAFNPMSYHNGSVWPHDNAIVALGLARSGQTKAMLPIFTGLFDVSAAFTNHRLPELFCGMTRERDRAPVHYPVSCIPQAWASGAFFMLLQAATGIAPNAPARRLHVRSPQLPGFLHELTVADLQVGRSSVSIHFLREQNGTQVQVLGVEGEPLEVEVE
jgi:glycogen debranching enzyme